MDRMAMTGPAVAESLLDLIGNTPMVALNRVSAPGSATILAKLEAVNPSGSVKDRTALAMIEDAERKGLLRAGGTVIEPSSGNTAIALALVGTLKGYRVLVVMPEDVSADWRRLIAHFGGEVHTTPSPAGMPGAIKAAQEMARKNSSHVLLKQFENPANPEAHRRTAAEILSATGGEVHAFVAAVGTGGTITGIGEVLKRRIPGITVIAVQPARSQVLTGGSPGEHRIYGIGANFIPQVLNMAVIDEVLSVSEEDASRTSHLLASKEGLFVGVSSGANVSAALKIAERLGPGKTVVTILPDTGARYLGLPR